MTGGAGTAYRQTLILGLHDMATGGPSGEGAERAYWMPLNEFEALHDELAANTTRNGQGLVITSDDAFASDYEVLFPWLMKRGLTATFFVPGDYIGQPNRLTQANIREMHNAGMAFGCHGAAHLDWTKMDAAALHADIANGRKRLEDVLCEPVTDAAAPFGGYNRYVIGELKAQGFTTVHTTRGGLAPAHSWLRTRNMLRPVDGVLDALRVLSRRRSSPYDRLRQTWHLLQARYAA
jgi:peptidoglycan/xylan/chitin deacetylase (PgdA/CDA1 family)